MIKQFTYPEMKRIKNLNIQGIIDHGDNFSIIPLKITENNTMQNVN